MAQFLRRITRPIRAVANTTIFFLKVFPMLPSRPVDWVTKAPVVQRVTYPTLRGDATGDLYCPATRGPHPAILVCLGVVPFEVDHPQVPVLGKALARAGFVTLLYWSPDMRAFRLVPDDVENIALAYAWLLQQPGIDPARSGLLGTCVGGSFALMAAAARAIRSQVAFVTAYAPFSSMTTFARDIAGRTCTNGATPEPWQVDPLTRKVFVHSLTAWLAPHEAAQLRAAFDGNSRDPRTGAAAGDGVGPVDSRDLSSEGRAIYTLLAAHDPDTATQALQQLPAAMQAHFTALSPLAYLQDILAPLIVLLHDRGDHVIPVGESRRLVAALDHDPRLHYTEMEFQHLDPLKGKLPLLRLVREFSKFCAAIYPIFRQAA